MEDSDDRLQQLGLTPAQFAGLDAYFERMMQRRLNQSIVPSEDVPMLPLLRDQSAEPPPTLPPSSRSPTPFCEGSTTPRASSPLFSISDSDTHDASSTTRKRKRSKAKIPKGKWKAATSESNSKSKKAKSVAPARPSQVHRVITTQWPPDTEKMRDTFGIHIQVLYDTLESAWIPRQPTPEALATFATRFGTHVDDSDFVWEITAGSPALIQLAQVQVKGTYHKHHNGRLAKNISSIGELNLRRLCQHFRPFGITKFAVDFSSDHSSLYNIAHEEIALQSFRQMLMGGAYGWIKFEEGVVGNVDVQEMFYRHYVFHVLKGRYMREVRKPGAAEDIKERDTARQRQGRLSKARKDWVRLNSKPEQYARIVDQNDAVSNDDALPEHPGVRHVWLRLERLRHANVLARRLDELMRQASYAQPGLQGHAPTTTLPRVMPQIPVKTRFSQFPYKLPIDYFDVGWFNSQDDNTKLSVATRCIAFPPNEAHILAIPPHPDELLSTTDLNKKYGAQVMAKYRWPTGELSAATTADDMDLQIGEDS